IILPDRPFGILNNEVKQEEVKKYCGAMANYNRLLDSDPELFHKQLDKLPKSKNPSTFNISHPAMVKTTLEKHNDAMEKYEDNINMKIFYTTILFQLEELFIECKRVASDKANPVDALLGNFGETMNLFSQVVAIVPVVGEYMSTVLQTSVYFAKKTDYVRQKNIITHIAHSYMQLQLLEISQSVAQTLAERYEPLIEQLRSPKGREKNDKENSTQKAAKTHWSQFSNERKELIGEHEDKSSAQVSSVEIVESQYYLGYTKIKQKLLKDEDKTEARDIGEYAVVLILAALLNGEIEAYSSIQAMEKELLQAVCIPLGEENKNTKPYFGKRQILTKNNHRWTLDGFYRKPGIRINEGEEYANQNTDTELYGFRLGTKEEVKQLGMTRISKSGSSS
ncbi:unnamed protein product, partial [Adineta steineri]